MKSCYLGEVRMNEQIALGGKRYDKECLIVYLGVGRLGRRVGVEGEGEGDGDNPRGKGGAG
jgi:hypothetical protein